MESGFSSQAITSGAIQYGVPMKVFLRPTVLSNWALTPKSTKGVQKQRHKTSRIDFHITGCKKARRRLIYQVWLLRSPSAAHSALWYLCEWLYGHGGGKGPADRQSTHSSQCDCCCSFVCCDCGDVPSEFLCRCTQSSPPSESCL